MSVPRSRSGGNCTVTTARRWYRSSRNRRTRMAAARSSLVAASTQASAGSTRVLAETPHRTILERLEQLDLQGVGHQPDLVEKDRAAMSDLQQSGLGLPGIGERATFVPEELGFEQSIGNRRAVDIDECRIRARAHPVNDVRNEPFACPCFPLYQHRRQAFRRNRQPREEAREFFADSRQCRACPEELVEHVTILSSTPAKPPCRTAQYSTFDSCIRHR